MKYIYMAGGIILVIIAGIFLFNREAADVEQPTDVVAIVNEIEITRGELTILREQVIAAQNINASLFSQEQRREFDRDLLQEIISQRLLTQVAEESGISISEDAIEGQMQAIRAQFETTEAYEAALSGEGLTTESLRTQVARDLLIEAYLEQELALSTLTATEAEILATYEAEVAGASGEVPTLEEVRGQVEMLVIQEKSIALVSELRDALVANAQVEIRI